MQRDEANDQPTEDLAADENEGNLISPKQRVMDNQGKQVPVDLFLYSCLEFERTSKSMEATGTERIEWSAIANQSDKLPEEMENLPLAHIVKKLVTWYRQEFSELSSPRPIDHERLMDIVEPLVSLNRDLGKVYRLKTGEDLPEYESSVGNNRAWDDIYTEIRDQFPTYQNLFNRYIQWSHATEPVETFEPGSRPPVGRYAPRPIRTGNGPRGRDGGGRGGFGSSGRGGRDDNRGKRGPGPRGDSGHDRPPSREPNGNSRFGNRPSRGEGGGGQGQGREPRRGFDDRPPRGSNRGGDRGPRNERPRGPVVRDEAESAKLEAAAIQDVNEAIKIMRTDSNQAEVILRPTNSFYRRLQHQCVVEAGFNSSSVGEGPDRAVRVSRTKPMDVM
jgi:hypothetical protein